MGKELCFTFTTPLHCIALVSWFLYVETVFVCLSVNALWIICFELCFGQNRHLRSKEGKKGKLYDVPWSYMDQIMPKGQSHLTLPRLNGFHPLLQSYGFYYFSTPISTPLKGNFLSWIKICYSYTAVTFTSIGIGIDISTTT